MINKANYIFRSKRYLSAGCIDFQLPELINPFFFFWMNQVRVGSDFRYALKLNVGSNQLSFRADIQILSPSIDGYLGYCVRFGITPNSAWGTGKNSFLPLTKPFDFNTVSAIPQRARSKKRCPSNISSKRLS